MGVYLTNRGGVPLQERGRWGDKKATETRLGACQHGLGSYNSLRATRPVNDPLLMTVILLLDKLL